MFYFFASFQYPNPGGGGGCRKNSLYCFTERSKVSFLTFCRFPGRGRETILPKGERAKPIVINDHTFQKKGGKPIL